MRVMKALNFKPILWMLVLGAVSVLVCNTVLVSYDHNEQMYVTAGVLVSQGQQLYTDFAYLQTPNLPLIYGLIFRLANTHEYLFLAKSMTFFFYLVAAFLLYIITKNLTKNHFWGVGVTTLFMLNSSVISAVEESSNYMLPITLTFAAFYIYLRAQEPSRWSYLKFLLSGICLALAMGTKLYYALLVPPFLFVLATYPHAKPFPLRLYRQLSPFFIGLLIGSMPILWYLIKDYRTFWFSNVGYHLLNAEWRMNTQYEIAMTVASKLTFTAKLFEKTNDVLLVAICALIFFVYRLIPPSTNRDDAAPRFLAMSLIFASLPTVIIPSPLFAQYYAMPMSLLFLLLAVLYPYTRTSIFQIGQALCNRFLLVIIFLSALLITPSFQKDVDRTWATIEIAMKSEEIAAALETYRDQPGKVATIAPLVVLEAGQAIYPEFATGPFLYRVGDLLPPHDRAAYKATSPETLSTLLSQDPPIAIFLVSDEDNDSYQMLEGPLRRFAEEYGYQNVKGDFDGSELYIQGP